MLKHFRIEMARRAEIALDRLPAHEKRQIELVLERVAETGLASRDISMIGKGARGEGYLIRAGRDLRIIAKRTDDLLEVLDIVRHDKLRQAYDTFRRGGAE